MTDINILRKMGHKRLFLFQIRRKHNSPRGIYNISELEQVKSHEEEYQNCYNERFRLMSDNTQQGIKSIRF